MEDKLFQANMMCRALRSRNSRQIQGVLHFYGNRTFYTNVETKLWINVSYYTDHQAIKLWKIMFDYGMNPCLRNNDNFYVMDIIVKNQSIDQLKFLLYYNVPIHSSVIDINENERFTFYKDFGEYTFQHRLCMSYLLMYSDFWARIIQYVDCNLNGLNTHKSLQPIMNFFNHHKNVPLSLQTLTVIAIRKNLKIGPLEKTLKSVQYPAALKDKISLIQEYEYVHNVAILMHDLRLY